MKKIYLLFIPIPDFEIVQVAEISFIEAKELFIPHNSKAADNLVMWRARASTVMDDTN